MISFGDDFRSHVSRSATEGIDEGRWFRFKAEAEVDETELAMPIDEDVLRLDVSMNDVPIMQVFQSFGDGLEEPLGFCLLQSVLGLGEQVVVERISSAVLLDQVDFGRGFDSFDQFGDNWVIEKSQDIDLPFQVLDFVRFI